MAAADWDARTYHQVSRPHLAWGTAVVDRLTLHGAETVLDAGCGSGGVTAQLLERLPRGHVIAVDRSPAMLQEARANLASHLPRLTFVQADLVNLHTAIKHQVDAVLSTATFHWIPDHAALFTSLCAVTRPGGQLVAQCGGGANLAGFAAAADHIALQPPFAAHLRGKHLWRSFYGVDDTRQRLLAAGYTRPSVWLEDSPQDFPTPDAFHTFCRTVVLSRHVAELPDALHEPFLSQVGAEVRRRTGAYRLDYVRLNLDARREKT